LLYAKDGKCKFGDRCKYKHVKLTQEDLDKATAEVQKKALLNKQRRENPQQVNAKSSSAKELDPMAACSEKIKILTAKLTEVYKIPSGEMNELLYAMTECD
jgi:hypothetical protein